MNGRVYAFVVAAALLAIAACCQYIARKSRYGTLPYGSQLGSRTKVTMANEDAWRAGHRAVAGVWWALAAIGFVAAIICVFAGALGPEPAAIEALAWMIALVYLVLVMCGYVVAIFVANRAARGPASPPSSSAPGAGGS